MGRKKRVKKRTVSATIEGKAEVEFLEFLKTLYLDPEKTAFKEEAKYGGSADFLLMSALKRSDRDRAFVWLDEDFVTLSKETVGALQKVWHVSNEQIENCPLGEMQARCNPLKRNPILIVSQPISVEALLIKAWGYSDLPILDPSKRGAQIKNLKCRLASIRGKLSIYEYCVQNLTKSTLQERRLQIPELNLLIEMLEGK